MATSDPSRFTNREEHSHMMANAVGHDSQAYAMLGSDQGPFSDHMIFTCSLHNSEKGLVPRSRKRGMFGLLYCLQSPVKCFGPSTHILDTKCTVWRGCMADMWKYIHTRV
jgi:hypothetical protein